MAATFPSSAATTPLLLRRSSAAPSLSFRRRRRWQRAAARRDDRGAQLAPPGARWLPPAAAYGGKGARGATAAAAAAAGEAPYRGGEGKGSLWMVFLSTAVAVCGSFEFGTCVGYSAPAQAGIVGDIGLSNSEVPVFISEIAPKNVRGGLATSNQLFICSGCSAAYIIGALLSWRSLVVVGLVPCAVLLVGLFFVPESPRWLANIGRETEFRASLQKMRGEDSDISEEATEIKDYVESIRSLPKAKIQDLFQSKNMYAVTVGVGLMIFQQLGGINALGFYTSYIFSSAGFSGKLGTILIGIIQIPITLFGALLMDRSGRRALLLVSSSGTFLGCFLTGLSFYFEAQGLHSQLVPTLALCGILVYYAAYSVGMGPVPWVIMSEIFSIDTKAIAGSLVTLVKFLTVAKFGQ